ncbi:pilus (MSHA type) biogenesis protein MshL [Candidatus Reidiella endopervernicosa]|nr:pilus (MSHA type) biogenesis protein MshL [Candidatus Reidiella endopervernicosa]
MSGSKKMKRLLPLMISSVVLSAGCSNLMEKRSTATLESINSEMAQSTQVVEQPAAKIPPPEVKAALMPGFQDMGSMGQPRENRFDITVNNVPAREFFMGLVKGTHTNMVVHPSVEGEISLSMKRVTVDEVMETVRRVYGYAYERSSTGYEVLSSELQTRIFAVNYLNVKRVGESQTRVSSGQVSSSESSSDSDDSDSSTSTTSEAVSGSLISTASTADFWTELDLAVRTIVCGGAVGGCGEGRSVVVSPQSGVVVVRARPAQLREVERYLDTSQNVMHRQVILEAKILEVELSDGAQSGINWSALAEQSSMNRSLTVGQTGGGSSIADGSSEIAGNTGVLDPNALSQIVGTSASAFGGVFSLALSSGDFTAFIELLKSQGDVQVLSSPRVATMNNQKAVIKVGNDEFFVTEIQSDTTSGTGGTTTTPEITLTPFFSGIALDVTPQISADGFVTLHIHPSVSEVTDQTKHITVGGQDQTLPLAFSSVRESDTIIRAQSGQVVVIGGLMKDKTSRDRAATPGLGDLPMVGNLFRHKRDSKQMSELVILLRPMVVKDQKDWIRELQKSQGRFNSFSGEMERRQTRQR